MAGRTLRRLLLGAAVLAAGHAAAVGQGAPAGKAAAGGTTAGKAPAPAPVQQRDATPEERDSFDSFYRERLPAGLNGAASLFAPTFDISRRRGEPWQVIARVDSAPRHFASDLCRQVRSSFIYDGKAKSWGPSAAEPEWHVWLTRPDVVCTATRYPVLMHPAVPKPDVAALLRQHRDLLLRARLLFAGSSDCARQRALTFRLVAIEPSAPRDGAPVMFGLVFESDRDTVAKVAVRRDRGEYTAWNVSCNAG
ncbi:hypothetical protein [Duganella aceris]|uniref:Uncharacterized protein n=1 Tax=Duganella aceris TaxID=2703883 RepID=A0ABX0FLV7_9BURK|nr:hypothetical protein [Duganella aceris]NGZ85585.1 hypothetical protein [Duganella aceris]